MNKSNKAVGKRSNFEAFPPKKKKNARKKRELFKWSLGKTNPSKSMSDYLVLSKLCKLLYNLFMGLTTYYI